jgi:hypothetical protein
MFFVQSKSINIKLFFLIQAIYGDGLHKAHIVHQVFGLGAAESLVGTNMTHPLMMFQTVIPVLYKTLYAF